MRRSALFLVVAVLGAVTGGCGKSSGATGSTGTTSPITAQSADASASTTTTSIPGQIQVVSYGFTQLPPDSIGNSYANEAAVLKWTGVNQAAEQVQVTLTLTNAVGAVVNSDEETVEVMFPGETVAVAHDDQVSGAAHMEVQASVGSTLSYTESPPSFTVTGVTTSDPDGFGETTDGTVTSGATVQLQETEATAVYYNSTGAVIGGDFTYINFIPAGGSTSFSITGDNAIPGIASTQVYVQVTSLTLAPLGG